MSKALVRVFVWQEYVVAAVVAAALYYVTTLFDSVPFLVRVMAVLLPFFVETLCMLLRLIFVIFSPQALTEEDYVN